MKKIILTIMIMSSYQLNAFQQRVSGLWRPARQAAQVGLQSLRTPAMAAGAGNEMTSLAAKSVSWWQRLRAKIESPLKKYFDERFQAKVLKEIQNQERRFSNSAALRWFNEAKSTYANALVGSNPLKIEAAAKELKWSGELLNESIKSLKKADAKYATGEWSYIPKAFDNMIKPIEKQVEIELKGIAERMPSYKKAADAIRVEELKKMLQEEKMWKASLRKNGFQ